MFPGNSNSVLGIEKRRLSNTCSNSNSTCIINNSNIHCTISMLRYNSTCIVLCENALFVLAELLYTLCILYK